MFSFSECKRAPSVHDHHATAGTPSEPPDSRLYPDSAPALSAERREGRRIVRSVVPVLGNLLTDSLSFGPPPTTARKLRFAFFPRWIASLKGGIASARRFCQHQMDCSLVLYPERLAEMLNRSVSIQLGAETD